MPGGVVGMYGCGWRAMSGGLGVEGYQCECDGWNLCVVWWCWLVWLLTQKWFVYCASLVWWMGDLNPVLGVERVDIPVI